MTFVEQYIPFSDLPFLIKRKWMRKLEKVLKIENK